MKKTNLCILTLIGLLSLSFTPIDNDYKIAKLDVIEEEVNTVNISNKDELINVINHCYIDSYSLNKTFNIVNDIDLNGESIPSINIFCGTLNGNDHKIYNFNLNKSKNGKEVGFIRKLTKEGKVNNLHVEYNLDLDSVDSVLGGIVGYNNGRIIDSSYSGRLKSNANLGGIAGYNEKDGIIENCSNNGEVISPKNTAGIVGINKGKVNNCVNKGIINDTRFSSSDEIKSSNIGGIVGSNSGSIINSVNMATIGIKQVGKNVGGIVGNSSGNIEYCQNFGIVKGNNNIGGITGYYNNLINLNSFQYCINEGPIVGENSIGGIIGNISNDGLLDIQYCYNEGSVTGNKDYVGGIVGYQKKGSIKESFNTGIINGDSSDYVGGIVGYSLGNVLNSFSINDIKGNNYVGGIAGQVKKLQNCYSISTISFDGNYIGALAGSADNIDNIIDNYYVYNGINAIDNIDYLNKAQRVDKNDLASKDTLNVNLDSNYWMVSSVNKSLPILKNIENNTIDNETVNLIKEKLDKVTRFGSYVKFIDEDGKIIKDVFIEYGNDLDENLIPLPPRKENYFASWEEFDSHNIKTNIYVNVIYKTLVTSVASEKGPSPKLIVEGDFYETTEVNIIHINNELKFDDYNYLGNYKLSVTDNINKINKSNLKYKIKVENLKGNEKIAKNNSDKLEFIDSYIDGNYICFNADDIDEVIIVRDKFASFKNPKFILIIVSASICTCGILTCLYFIIKHFRKKKKTNK